MFVVTSVDPEVATCATEFTSVSCARDFAFNARVATGDYLQFIVNKVAGGQMVYSSVINGPECYPHGHDEFAECFW